MKLAFTGFPSGTKRGSSPAGQVSASQPAQQSSIDPAAVTPAQASGLSAKSSLVTAQSASPFPSSSSLPPGSATRLPPPPSQVLASSSLSLVPRHVAKKLKPTASISAQYSASRLASNTTPHASSTHSQSLPVQAPRQGPGIVTQPRGVIFKGGEITAMNVIYTGLNHQNHASRKITQHVTIPPQRDTVAIANRPASPGTPAYIYKNDHKTNPKEPNKITIHAGDILRVEKSTSTMVAVRPPNVVKTGFYVENRSTGQRTSAHAERVFLDKIKKD